MRRRSVSMLDRVNFTVAPGPHTGLAGWLTGHLLLHILLPPVQSSPVEMEGRMSVSVSSLKDIELQLHGFGHPEMF